MAYTVNINGYDGSQADSIVYSGYHKIIDTNQVFIDRIRNAVPKYADVQSVTVTVPEFEKGYSWGSAKYWFADTSGNKITGESKLSNNTNYNLTTSITGYMQSKTAKAGEFSSISGIRIYFKDTVPVDFVTRDPYLTYTFIIQVSIFISDYETFHLIT